jgi:hypothetical protein
MEDFKYTEQQKSAYDQLVIFLEHKTKHDFLLMGPAIQNPNPPIEFGVHKLLSQNDLGAPQQFI